MIGFCCLNFGEFTKTTTGYAYENNGIRFKPIKKEKGLRLPCLAVPAIKIEISHKE
jgi:hypothetical protein